MRTLYLDCQMGAAGDMLTAALLELVDHPSEMVDKLNQMGIPGVKYSAQKTEKNSIKGTIMTVTVNGIEEGSEEDMHQQHDHHHGRSLKDIQAIVNELNVPTSVKGNILNVYTILAEAEGHVHGKPMNEVHFHEIGTMDAIADVAAVSMMLSELSPDKIVASEVHVGYGQVQTAHGILPVPAPATAYILRDIPTVGGNIKGELCTPTGAALLQYFADEFASQPTMRVEKIGYGCGKKDFEQANVLRAFFGDSADALGHVIELSCNLDDMTPEEIGYAQEKLFEAGALDVYTQRIGMKKNRPGTMLTAMCKGEDKEDMIEAIFLHTTTLGIREYDCKRYTLHRQKEEFQTSLGTVRRKTVSGWGTSRSKLEYEDLADISRKNSISIMEARHLVEDEIEDMENKEKEAGR